MQDKRFAVFSVLVAAALASCLLPSDIVGESTVDVVVEPGPKQVPDPGVADTVWVTSFDLQPGQTEFDLQVHLYNDEELAGISIPLGWDSPDISLLSVSFTGSRVDYIGIKGYEVDNANQRLALYAIVFFESYLQPGNGLICTLHFSVAPTLDQQTVVVDTTFYPPAADFTLNLPSGANIYPQMKPGYVTASFVPTENTTWGRLKQVFKDI